jgi:hypothetical protein
MKQNLSGRGCKEGIHAIVAIRAVVVRLPRVCKRPLGKVVGIVIVYAVVVVILTCAVGTNEEISGERIPALVTLI